VNHLVCNERLIPRC